MYGRRRFLKNALIWVPAGTAAALLAACSDSSDSAEESALSNCSLDGNCDTAGDIHDAISANHAQPHAVALTQAQVDAGQAVTLTLSPGGTGNHTHTVMLTAAMIADIAAGMQLRVDSSNDASHTHCVTFNCSTGGGGGGGYERKA